MILDPFIVSDTTIYVCEQLKRKRLGCE
ncbi:hypothetical protein [Spiroplasma endosymbiont of Polydrusus formosus]